MGSVIYTSHTGAAISAISKAKATALETIGGMAESYAKKRCPTKTGNLKNSITHAPISDSTIAIGTTVEYAPYVELGHHQQPGRYVPAIGKRLKADYVPPKAFLGPAVEEHEAEYANVIKTVLSSV